jgi:hypothetical protein
METDLGHWKPGDGLSQEIPENSIGFVYLIIDPSGKKYIGKKLLVNKTCKKPLKGRINKRRGIKESNWKSYISSSPKVQENIEKTGIENYQFIILKWAPNKMMLAYYETKEIIDRNAIFDLTYWNEVCNIRIRNKK